MNQLTYKIAWIDDQSITNLSGRLAGKLARQGLELVVEAIATAAELQTFVQTLHGRRDLDLIMVDWKLGAMVANGSGATVSKAIRDQQSYTDIIFYSASEPGVLRAAIAAQQIDGVWCVNRNFFVNEAWHVVEATLHRVDLNSMRGLFMSSVADFDHQMRGGLLQAHSAVEAPIQQRLAKAFVDRRLAYAQEQVQNAEKLESEVRLHELLKDAGTFELLSLMKDLASWVPPIDALHSKAILGFEQFYPQVIQPRNDLAHARSNGDVLSRAGRTYDTNRFSELRTYLLEHQENLEGFVQRFVPEIAKRLNAGLKKHDHS